MGKKPKKALILGEAFYPEVFIINDLVKEWEKEGYEFEVLTRAPSYPFGKVYPGYKNRIYQKTRFNSIKIHRFPVWQGYQKSTLVKLLNYLSFVFWSTWIILFIGRRFDRVFIYQTGPLTLATAGILMKKFFGAKTTLWIQDLWPETVYAYGFRKTRMLDGTLRRFVRWVYRNSDHIHVCCDGFTERVRNYVPADTPIDFIPNWPLPETGVSSAEKIELPGRINFTFAGNVGKVQNLDNVLLGFGKYVARHPEAWLNIIGDGSHLENLKQLVAKEQIPNVNFTGRKPVEEMNAYYTASDVLIISLIDVPLYEIMIPSKFPTYLTTNKPVYAVMKGEVAQMVNKYRLGQTADPSDTGAIASGFETFSAMSPGELAQCAENSSVLLESVFDRNALIEKITRPFWQ